MVFFLSLFRTVLLVLIVFKERSTIMNSNQCLSAHIYIYHISPVGACVHMIVAILSSCILITCYRQISG
jgi:hypothetical protein